MAGGIRSFTNGIELRMPGGAFGAPSAMAFLVRSRYLLKLTRTTCRSSPALWRIGYVIVGASIVAAISLILSTNGVSSAGFGRVAVPAPPAPPSRSVTAPSAAPRPPAGTRLPSSSFLLLPAQFSSVSEIAATQAPTIDESRIASRCRAARYMIARPPSTAFMSTMAVSSSSPWANCRALSLYALPRWRNSMVLPLLAGILPPAPARNVGGPPSGEVKSAPFW